MRMPARIRQPIVRHATNPNASDSAAPPGLGLLSNPCPMADAMGFRSFGPPGLHEPSLRSGGRLACRRAGRLARRIGVPPSCGWTGCPSVAAFGEGRPQSHARDAKSFFLTFAPGRTDALPASRASQTGWSPLEHPPRDPARSRTTATRRCTPPGSSCLPA